MSLDTVLGISMGNQLLWALKADQRRSCAFSPSGFNSVNHNKKLSTRIGPGFWFPWCSWANSYFFVIRIHNDSRKCNVLFKILTLKIFHTLVNPPTLQLRFISEDIQMSIGEGSKLISHCCKCKSQKHNFLFTDLNSSWNLGKLVWESCHLELSAVCHQLKGITNRMSQAPASNLASSCPNFGTMNRISEANCETSAGPRGCALIGRATYGFWPMRGLGQGASIWGKAWGILCRKLHNQICCHFIGGPLLIIPLMLKLRQHFAACCFMASKPLRAHCRANQLNTLPPEKKTPLDFQKCF